MKDPKSSPQTYVQLMAVVREWLYGLDNVPVRLTHAETDSSLREVGFDPEALRRRVTEELRAFEARSRLDRAGRERQAMAKLAEEHSREEKKTWSGMDRNAMLDAILQISKTHPRLALAYRSFAEFSDEDLRSALEDISILLRVGNSDGAPR